MNEEKSNVIIIDDLLSSKKRKEEELKFYEAELNKLMERMKWLKMEIRLTEDIIKMIRKEEIVDIKKLL